MMSKINYGTVVKGDLKAPFSIATTPKFYGRVLLLLPLICSLKYWVLSKEASSTIFGVFGMTQPGIEPKSPKPLANTLTIMPKDR